jgi:hypothetical protein
MSRQRAIYDIHNTIAVNVREGTPDVARRQGVSAETLVNLWVSDHLQQAAG